MTNTIDLDKLEQVAKSIEHGLWDYGGKAYGDEGGHYYNVTNEIGDDVLGEYGVDEKEARYIAEACPAVVLELVRRLRAAEAWLAALSTMVDTYSQREPLSVVHEIKERLRAAEADAARYQFLRSPDRGMSQLSAALNQADEPPFFELKCGLDLDITIDDAIAAQGASHG